MSELKAIHVADAFDNYFEHPCKENARVYLKPEVDAVLEAKDAKILHLNAEVMKQKHHAKLFFDERNYAETQLRHQKYKRCIGLAERCHTKSNYHFVLARHGEDVKENNRKSVLYSKWHKRWLELAEKFKPAK